MIARNTFFTADTRQWVIRTTGALVFLLPVTSILLKSAVSLVFGLFALGGLFWGFRAWSSLLADEKKLLIGYAAFCLLVALSFFESDGSLYYSSSLHFEKYTSFIWFGLVYLYLRRLATDVSDYLIAGMVVAPYVWLLYHWLHPAPRFSGAYYAIMVGDIAIYCATLLLAAVLTLSFSKKQKMLIMISAGLCLVTSVLSESRGAWLYLPVLVLLLIFLYRQKINTRYQLTGGILLLLIAIGAFSFNPTQSDRASVIDELKLYEKSPEKFSGVGVRIHMWQDSLRLFLKSPLVGIGVGDYELETKKLLEKGESTTPKVFGHAHNIFMNTLATTGLAGFAGLLFVLGWPLKIFISSWRQSVSPRARFYALAGIMTIAAFMVFGLTESWLSRNPMVRYYLLSLAILAYGALKPTLKAEYQPKNNLS